MLRRRYPLQGIRCFGCPKEALLLLLSCSVPAFPLLLERGSRLRKTAWMGVIAKVPLTPTSDNLTSKSDTRLNAQVPSSGKGCIPFKSVPTILWALQIINGGVVTLNVPACMCVKLLSIQLSCTLWTQYTAAFRLQRLRVVLIKVPFSRRRISTSVHHCIGGRSCLPWQAFWKACPVLNFVEVETLSEPSMFASIAAWGTSHTGYSAAVAMPDDLNSRQRVFADGRKFDLCEVSVQGVKF